MGGLVSEISAGERKMPEPNWIVVLLVGAAVGALLSIPLNLVANLVTPGLQDWLVSRSLANKGKQLKRIEQEYARVKELHEDRDLLNLRIAQLVIRLLSYLVFWIGLDAIASALGSLSPMLSPFRILAGGLAVVIASRYGSKLTRLAADLHWLGKFAEYEAHALGEMQRLRESAANAPLKGRRIRTPKAPAKAAAPQGPVFRDAFESFSGWQQYGKGTLSHSKDQSLVEGGSLKKEGAGDPHGGYKEFGTPIDQGFVLTGAVFRPAQFTGGKAERLALEDSNQNGYGFSVDRNLGVSSIDRRVQGSHKVIRQAKFVPPAGSHRR